MFHNHNQNPESLRLLNQSLRLLRQSAPEPDLEVALAFVQRGQQLGRSGQSAEGVESIKEGLAIFQAQNHVLGMVYALQLQGEVEAGWGRLGKAAESQAEALRLLEGRSSHDYWLIAHIAHMLAVTWLMQGRYQQAEVLFHRVIDHYATFHPPPAILAFARRNLGDLAIAMGNFEAGEEYFAKAASHFARLEMTWNLHIPMVANAGVMARLRGDLDEAERLLTQSLSTARQVGLQQRIAINLHNLARLRHDQGRYPEEIELLDEALQIARRIDSRFATALVLCQLGHAATAFKQPEVLGYYAEALQIATAEQIDRVVVEVLTGVAQLMIQKHNHDLAVALLSLVQNHTASEFETKRKAHRLLLEVETQLPVHQFVEGQRRGQALALQDIVSNLFDGYLYNSVER
jgi:tetratricopeptide (TPR) repeat protein